MDKRQIIIHIIIAVLAACILYICSRPLVTVPDSVLITDVVASGIVLSGLLLLLSNIVAYNPFSNLSLRQKLINYSALAILFVTCWIVLEYFVLYISFPPEKWQLLYPLLPVRILIAIFIYIITILIHSVQQEREPEEKENESGNENIVRQTIPEEMQKNEPETIEILERIAVKNGQKIEVIPVHEIACILAEGDYVMIHSQKGRYLKEQTMKSLEAGLPSDKFVRVHRSSIVNVDFIAQIELYDKQNQLLKLKNGVQVKVSQAGYRSLKSTIGL
ncbi:hypothetical protein GGR21_003138 [Dysgonomonas hofstadii]|uniref:HTH LytTR-type domain-containing protein n=1 Tax=Dysgonomonas hofstadii TaxID=637886 RepID=A0A840CQA4_9BACT|nr:LytTR family DNA-binding domain-containing protein [Dysgonomonas hofstadii]MBB4037221.1 hypothetical protein [Dysgonomonas hofstadii]